MTTSAPTDDAPDLSLRAPTPRPRRLSRRVLLAGAFCAGGVIAFALASGLSVKARDRGDRIRVASASGPPETIANAPASYMPAALAPTAANGSDEETLAPPEDPFWRTTASPTQEGAPPPPPRAPPTDVSPPADVAPPPLLFARATSNTAGSARLAAQLERRSSEHVISAGSIIPAALVTALNSDAPGRVIAQVTSAVFDSVTGAHELIPQGARLIGDYEGVSGAGDARLRVTWTRLVLPDGSSLAFGAMPASDPSGAAGLRDRVDLHADRLVGAAALSSLLSVAANSAAGDDTREARATETIANAAAQEAARTGARIVDRALTIRPTITVRAGAPVIVLVDREINLPPIRRPVELSSGRRTAP